MLYITGLRKLKLDQSNDYCLVLVKNGTEEMIDSFEKLPNNSVLRFKVKEAKRKNNSTDYGNEIGQKIKKKLKLLEDDMDLILDASGNDLKLLAEMNIKTFEKNFNSEFLQKVVICANQVLLMKQENNDIKGIEDPWYLSTDKSGSKIKDAQYEFSVSGQQIGKYFRSFISKK